MTNNINGTAGYPLKFYKYRSMSGDAAKLVERTTCQNEIYFPSANYFNDPFDLKPTFDFEAPPEVKRQDFERLSNKFSPNISKVQRKIEIQEVMSGPLHPENLKDTELLTQQMYAYYLTTFVGVYCVSTKRDDILMWSHYGDSHKGVCLEFDGESVLMAQAHKVVYSTERRGINPYFDSSDVAMEKALLSKSEHWKYEDEWRLFRTEEGPGPVSFQPAHLSGVVIGAQATPETIRKVRDWATERSVPLVVYRAFANAKSYALDIRLDRKSKTNASPNTGK